MGRGTGTPVRRIAGRVEEQRLLSSAVESAAKGEPCAFFVHGEAGTGKTHLVKTVCEQAAGNEHAVLWGRCVRFGSVDSPYLPLVNALEGWLEFAEPEQRSDVLAAVDGVGELLPSLASRADKQVRLVSILDGLVQAIAARQPTVLVIDDLQWADPASRDALAYLIAGFRRQRLIVLATLRDEELLAGDPMHGWLADLRRLPLVHEIRLDRLTRDETNQQIALLFGGEPHPRLVDAVHDLTHGNAYFTELLVTGLTPDDEHLPDDLPTALRQALLAAWHGLTPPTRELVRLLAVAGRPARVDDLTTVAADHGIGAADVTAGLAEATERGIVVLQDADTCWLRHPLLADVLYDTLVPGEAASIHTSWAKVLETGTGHGIDELRRQADLARHYEGSGDLAACFDASLRAADLARQAKALREAATHLSRAARLWPAADGRDAVDGIDEAGLLARLARTSLLVGDTDGSLAALDRALELVDPDIEPLRASRLLTDWSDARLETDGSLAGEPTAAARRAVELAQPFPDSPEHAYALAALSGLESSMSDIPAAQAHAEQALETARRSGSNQALSAAYRARGEAFGRDERYDHDSRESLRYALMGDDPETTVFAFIQRQNYLRLRGRLEEFVEIATAGLRFGIGAGASSLAAFQAFILSSGLLWLGRIADARAVVREGLSHTGTPDIGAQVRLIAARLAVRTGDLDAAGLHLQRARELIPTFEERFWMPAPPIIAEYLLAKHEPRAALDLLSRTLPVQSVDPRSPDEMLAWGARAAADLAETARDRHDPTSLQAAQAALDELVTARTSLPRPPFEVLVPDDAVQPAMEALFQAETQRCAAQGPTSDAWQIATHRCEASGMRWEQAIASWRWAQALLAEEANRSTVAVPLRSAHRYATEQGAAPLRRDIEALAISCRIALDEPERPAGPEPAAAPFNTLTKREHEVLSHLVAGRTYAEIADALFISEKTVSVHVSNLLHKTGTNSRRQVSALALRTGQTPPTPESG